MADEFTPKHGMTLNVSGLHGKPTIFLLNVFPDSIENMQPAPQGGTELTLKQPNGQPVKVEVTQTPDRIRWMIVQCKKLDSEA